MSNTTYDVTKGELEKEHIFPVPWGYIAAKSWNDSTGIPVLLLHGAMDNAGTWDQLIPLLPKCYYFVAIDFPGHGRSSHFPPGLPIKFFDFMLAIEYVVDQLLWENFIYIGHSFGGYVGFFYCSIFPKRVLKFISLDAGVYLYTNAQCAEHIAHAYNALKHVEHKLKTNKPPEYSFEEAVKKISSSHDEPINEESAKILGKRSLIKTSGGGYKFSLDQRMKVYEHARMSVEQCMALFKQIKCPLWIIAGDQSLIRDRENWNYFEFIRTHLQKTLREFRYIVIDGINHNAVMNHPDRVSKIVAEFLLNQKSQL